MIRGSLYSRGCNVAVLLLIRELIRLCLSVYRLFRRSYGPHASVMAELSRRKLGLELLLLLANVFLTTN